MDGNTVTITLTLSDGNTVEQSFKVYNGASAYEVWLQAGNTGTEQDYLDSLKGAPGEDGQPGEDGEDGAPGEKGDPGTDGLPGADGKSFVWQSDWDTDTAYVIDDVVRYQGSSFIAIEDNTGVAPDEAGQTQWDLMAEKGDNGTAEGAVLSVDTILPDINGDLVLSAPKEQHVLNSDATIQVSMQGIQNRALYVFVTGGLATIELTDWDTSKLHSMARVRLVLGTNNPGQFVVRRSGSGSTQYIYDLDGVYRLMQPMTIPPSSLMVIDIVNTLGGPPALVQVYPSQ